MGTIDFKKGGASARHYPTPITDSKPTVVPKPAAVVGSIYMISLKKAADKQRKAWVARTMDSFERVTVSQLMLDQLRDEKVTPEEYLKKLRGKN